MNELLRRTNIFLSRNSLITKKVEKVKKIIASDGKYFK